MSCLSLLAISSLYIAHVCEMLFQAYTLVSVISKLGTLVADFQCLGDVFLGKILPELCIYKELRLSRHFDKGYNVQCIILCYVD